MAIASTRHGHSYPFSISPGLASALYYVAIGSIAALIGVGAALMSADASLFDECFASCAGISAGTS